MAATGPAPKSMRRVGQLLIGLAVALPAILVIVALADWHLQPDYAKSTLLRFVDQRPEPTCIESYQRKCPNLTTRQYVDAIRIPLRNSVAFVLIFATLGMVLRDLSRKEMAESYENVVQMAERSRLTFGLLRSPVISVVAAALGAALFFYMLGTHPTYYAGGRGWWFTPELINGDLIRNDRFFFWLIMNWFAAVIVGSSPGSLGVMILARQRIRALGDTKRG